MIPHPRKILVQLIRKNLLRGIGGFVDGAADIYGSLEAFDGYSAEDGGAFDIKHFTMIGCSRNLKAFVFNTAENGCHFGLNHPMRRGNDGGSPEELHHFQRSRSFQVGPHQVNGGASHDVDNFASQKLLGYDIMLRISENGGRIYIIILLCPELFKGLGFWFFILHFRSVRFLRVEFARSCIFIAYALVPYQIVGVSGWRNWNMPFCFSVATFNQPEAQGNEQDGPQQIPDVEVKLVSE